jgi:hypothetical protein
LEQPNWSDRCGNAPLGFTNLNTAPGWSHDGTALSVDTNCPAFLNLPVISDGEANTSLTSGTISFWFQPNYTSVPDGGDGPTNWASLLTIGQWTSNAAASCWSLVIDPNGTNLIFLAQSNGAEQIVLTAPIDFDAGDWHNVYLTYCPTNCCLYLEGQPVTNAGPIAYLPSDSDRADYGFFVGSEGTTGIYQARGQFQNLETYDGPFSADEVASEYADESAIIVNRGGSLPSGGFSPDNGPGLPDGGSGSGSESGFYLPTYVIRTNYLDYTNFWLAVSNSATQVFVSVVSTLPGLTYEIMTNSGLATTNWGLWQTNLLASNSITPAPTIALNSNALFFKGLLLGYVGSNAYYPGTNANGAPSIITQPASQIVNQGTSATFTVVAVGATPLRCQWSFDGTNISGATNSSYTISDVQAANVGWYVAVVTNVAGSVTSAVATLTTSSSPPCVISQPTNQTNYDGSTATFSVWAIGALPLSYQWRFSGTNTISDATNIPGATNSSLVISDVQATNRGNYVVTVTNLYGSVTSVVVTLTRSNAAPTFVYVPISQTLVESDTVTFSARAVGTEPITYQWQKYNTNTSNFDNLTCQTSNRLVDVNMQYGDAGTYAVIAFNSVGSNCYTNAVLDDITADTLYVVNATVMPVYGPRQDYTFQAGNTYYIFSGDSFTNVTDLYGTTTIQGGAVLKFDYDEWSYVASVALHGPLVCDTGPYNPAILTSVDDDSQGEPPIVWWNLYMDISSGEPETANNGYAYLNLDDVHDTNGTSLNNLRFCYADLAVTTPTNSGVLDLWNCQFLYCNSALNSRQTTGVSTNTLHNVLVSSCETVFASLTNTAELDGEQVTADVWSFTSPEFPPGKVCLTNSIVLGDFGRGMIISNQNVAINPAPSTFAPGDDASYYLAMNSACRGAGTVNISAPMLHQLRQKTTTAPMSFIADLGIDEMTLFPVVKRYSGGAPDLGFYYDALDYTVAAMLVTNEITVLPGTAIGIRNDDLGGFFLQDDSSFVAHGTPTNPIIFTDIEFVQEGPLQPGCVFQASWWDTTAAYPFYSYGGIDFFCAVAGIESNSSSPILDERFCKFYATADDYSFWTGVDPYPELQQNAWAIAYSDASSVYWTMQDCTVHGGQIVLGQPFDWSSPNEVYVPGAVSWVNNLFDSVSITLDPSFHPDDGNGNDGTPNVDLPFYACNNLFRGALWDPFYESIQPLIIVPTTTSAGDWVFRNNLFDAITMVVDTNQSLEADHNGYWPSNFNNNWSSTIPWCLPSSAQVVSELPNGEGAGTGTDRILTNPPPYQVGPFGNYYMAPGSKLANAGSAAASQLGLYHYTTATNQTIQGTNTVDIGLHYLAASYSTNGWVPLDTDGDGIPDYVEDRIGNGATGTNAVALGETDWLNPKTDDVNYDPSNAVYRTIDLDGDGMVGLVESNLHKNPVVFDNPMFLSPYMIGSATNIFMVQVLYSLLTSVGQLELMVDSIPAPNQQTEMAPDGNTLLAWDSTTNNPGESYYLQAHLTLNGTNVTADGPILLYNQPPITIQPMSQTNGMGGTATFTTTGTTLGPYSYQWQINGTNIPGATGSSLTVTNLSSTNQGNYTVIVTNQSGDWWESTDAVLVVSNVNIGITMQPMSQTAFEPDTVTFAVSAVGTHLTYQWQEWDGSSTFTNIPNATSSNYTLYNIQYNVGILQSVPVGTYDVVVSNGVDSLASASATLTDNGPVDAVYPVMPVIGPRQDYVFKGNTTYCIGDPYFNMVGGLDGLVDLYGNTTIEGGAVIKFDLYVSTNVGLIVHGSLNCNTQPYHPATLTLAADDSQGEFIFSDGIWTPAPLGSTYLNLDDAHPANSLSISNLRFFYADQAVTTPTNNGILQVWDCQFCDCDSCVNSRLPGGCSTNQLHNVLFSDCNFAVAAQNDCAEVDAEQVTANVLSFCDTEFFPSRLCMTNCIVVGTIGEGPVVSTLDVANPSTWPFQSANDGNYYLPLGSPYRSNGTVNISQPMLAELAHKTTYAPISFPANMTISGQLTLFPQAARYTGGSPDLGYAYDPLDYTMADMVVQGGTITVLRGTAIGFRNDDLAGVYLEDNSLFTSQGTPTQPIVFTDNTLVQDGPFAPGRVYNQYLSSWMPGFEAYGGPAFFVPLPTPNDNLDAAPQVNMRFCNFFMTQDDFGMEAGYSQLSDGGNPYSFSSSVVWNMQDCSVYGGQIVLGDQDGSTNNPPGSVSWLNNLFEETLILLQPSYDSGSNPSYVDLPFQADNNLFKGGILALDPITTSQGSWQLQNNLFDMEDFWQNTNQPLNYNYNGWWTNSGGNNMLLGSLAAQLTSTQSGDGSNDRFLTNPPPYQIGPFGNYYMSSNTILAIAGSTSATNLGLYHYTTTTNQTIQGTSIVDIGLHYLAASYSVNGWVPLDTDGDGIPDYVEDSLGIGATGSAAVALGETDWLNPMTDGVNYDPSNSVYLNVDLAGNGLTGAMDQWLGISALQPDSPLQFPASSGTMIVSNTLTFDLSIDPNIDTNTAIFLLTIDGVTMNAEVYETNYHWIAQWDSTEVSNGIHEINFEVQQTEDDNPTVVSSTLVNARNIISFPYFIPIAGGVIYVAPQTIYTNGTWQMEIYDDESNLFASLNGQVDANGFCDDPVTSQPGISVNNLDRQNNQLPSTYYTIQLAVYPSTNACNSASGGSSGSPMQATKQLGTDVANAWQFYPGQWIVTYQAQFAPGTTPDTSMVGCLAVLIDCITNSGTWNANSIIGSPLVSGGIMPFVLGNYGHQDWSMPPYNGSVRWNMLATQYLPSHTTGQDALNLYYFGHFDKNNNLGGTSVQSWAISQDRLQNQILLNGPSMPWQVNHHPYRFVFIDGCNSGKRNLCLAFGIPNEETTMLAMQTQKLQPRAFVGWKNYKVSKLGSNGGLTYDIWHLQYIAYFFSLWANGTSPTTHGPYRLNEALNNADGPLTAIQSPNGTAKPTTSFFEDIQIYGADDLLFNQ